MSFLVQTRRILEALFHRFLENLLWSVLVADFKEFLLNKLLALLDCISFQLLSIVFERNFHYLADIFAQLDHLLQLHLVLQTDVLVARHDPFAFIGLELLGELFDMFKQITQQHLPVLLPL